jgi:hypothetical protein
MQISLSIELLLQQLHSPSQYATLANINVEEILMRSTSVAALKYSFVDTVVDVNVQRLYSDIRRFDALYSMTIVYVYMYVIM